MPIVPDSKDWTWVVDRPCPECRFDTSSFDREQVGQMIRDNAAAWREVLAGGDEVRRRPSDAQWSALEYACHVRDVFRLYLERLGLMLDQDDPVFPDWDQNVTAIDDRYAEQEPGTVSGDLGAAAGPLADGFDAVSGAQWERTGTRSDGAHFTVESFARYFIHDPIHHLHDVAAGFDALDRSE